MSRTHQGSAQPNEEREYLLGTKDDEYQRLGFQHRVWAADTAALWLRAGFAPGQTLVDVGCGPGFASIDLAYLVGVRGRVLAIDASPRFVAQLETMRTALRLPQIEARVGDVLADDLDRDLRERTIDGAFVRWVLCFLADPARVVQRLARALRPGGALVVMDYFHYGALALAPQSAAMSAVAQAVQASWRASGGDLDVGARLPALLAQHGLAVEELRPIVHIGRPGTPWWSWPDSFFSIYVPKLVAMGHLAPAVAEEFTRDWAARAHDPHAFFLTPPVLGLVARRPR